MKNLGDVDKRPTLVAIAGPHGAGKSTFYKAHLASSGLRIVDPDALARELRTSPEDAEKLAQALRRTLVAKKESFIFQTANWDPVQETLGALKEAAAAGYTVVFCFIGLGSLELSEERVAMRVSQGGHDVSPEELQARYARSLSYLKAAARELPRVIVFDNSEQARPFREVVVIEGARCVERAKDLPAWVAAHLFAKAKVDRPAGDASAHKVPGRLTMNVTRRPEGKAILRVEGSIDPSTYKKFEVGFAWCDKEGIRYLAVDMALLTYISSAALSLLIKYKSEYVKQKGDIILVRPQTPIINVMRILGLIDLFRIASSVEEALLPPSY
ncbi:MAG TPA: STAS domain-containing protein [Planctomycetota bacterium]